MNYYELKIDAEMKGNFEIIPNSKKPVGNRAKRFVSVAALEIALYTIFITGVAAGSFGLSAGKKSFNFAKTPHGLYL